MKRYQVMIFNALVLIIIGAYGYVISGSLTALLAPAIGVLLLLFVIPLKKGKEYAAKTTTTITAIVAVMFLVVGFVRGNSLIIIMAVVSLAAVIFYVSSFVKQKSQK
jgi:hypothetical protein